MAQDKQNPESHKEKVPTPIDPSLAAEAIEEVNQPMAIRPKRRCGCLGCFAGCGVVLLGAFVYWNFLRTPLFKISKETTYITEPLTSDGTRVDYFAASERSLYPPEMKTDDNGYWLIVRALGHDGHRKAGDPDDVVEARAVQAYEKLGLDPAIKPTMTCITPGEFLREYAATEGLDEKQARELDVYKPWTLDDLPMMEPWLEDAGPVLDLVAEAVRKPAYCFPLIRLAEEVTFVEVGTFYDGMHFGDATGASQFAGMLQTRANYRIGIGDIDGAIDDATTCQRLGRHVGSRGTIISIAVEEIAASLGVAAIRESQPTEEQLQRWVDELNAIPPRRYTHRIWLDNRYGSLDNLQAWAMTDRAPAGLLADWLGIDDAKAEYLTVDWNIVMRRVNELYDGVDGMHVSQRPPRELLPGYLFIGVRSRRVGELMADSLTSLFHEVREADRRSNCMDNLHRITLAMLIHERRHGTLPPAYTVDADGNPLHSWRVLLLPYLGEEELLGKVRLDEPWDSQHNRRFHDTAVPVYQCPSAELALGQTTYSVVIGERTAFAAGEGKSLDDLGMNLILVVEREQPVCWMDPMSEVTEVVARKGINRIGDGVGSPHPGGMDVGFRDGGVRFIPATIELPSLQGLLDGSAEDCRY